MTLEIPYESRDFPAIPPPRHGTLHVTWSDLIWAAITIGRPSKVEVFQHGTPSLYEALFRLSLIRMALQEGGWRSLHRTDAFSALDPTEKGMVSYFLGMTLCKLFASKLLDTDWLLHLDVYRPQINPQIRGRSRPDLVGKDSAGRWHGFECKGRSSAPSADDKQKAKAQAQRLISVDGTACTLHIGSFAYFRSEALTFFWRDPEPEEELEPIQLPTPREEWRHYYACALALSSEADDPVLSQVREEADVQVSIHPEIRTLLMKGAWEEAHLLAIELRGELDEKGYRADGIIIKGGPNWSRDALV